MCAFVILVRMKKRKSLSSVRLIAVEISSPDIHELTPLSRGLEHSE